jgi:hypothetical protein
MFINHPKSVKNPMFCKKRYFRRLLFKTDGAAVSKAITEAKHGVTEEIEVSGVVGPERAVCGCRHVLTALS